MTCRACGQPLEPGRHPAARYCLRRACASQRAAAQAAKKAQAEAAA